jgi:hypothetical protein
MRPVHLPRRLAGARNVRIGRIGFRGLCLAGALALVVGCRKKPTEPSGPAPEITGLAAVPATAEAVLGVDVGKLADAPVIDRVVEQLLLRNPVLSERWQRLRSDCKIALGKQVKRIMLAIGPHPGSAPGTGPVIMVVVGSIPRTA